MYIAENDAVPCGCIAITHTDESTAQIRFYFIEQEMRGKGAGHRLIDLAIGFCRKMKYKQVFLWGHSVHSMPPGTCMPAAGSG
jgi:N-acetylglutamate synthase-like GNAT family acetyltransferase